jgi:1,4-alpha-glucan branching enzyme
MKDCVRDLCLLLRNEPAMYQQQFTQAGFEWIDLSHRQESVIVYRRKGLLPEDDLLVILNMTPVVRQHWKVYAHGKTSWKEIFNSNETKYWGTGDVFNPDIPVTLVDKNTQRFEINLQLPALGAIVLK